MKKLPIVDEHEGVNAADDSQLVLCPVCQDTNVHFSNETKSTPPETYLAGNRGGGITIEMSCESGHYWDMIIGFHKGNTSITSDNFKQSI